MEQNTSYKDLKNKGFSMVEIVVIIAIMIVLLAILTPSLLRYVEGSRMQKDDTAMDELCGTVQLALADAETFDEACSYAILNNYVTYTDSSGVYGAKYTDEEFWAPDGSGHAVTITFNPDENGNYTIANGLVNDMTYGNGSVADSRTADGLKQCYFSEMGDGKLYHKVEQTFGTTFNEKSATYNNSSYTVFIKLDVVNGIKRANVYGEWNGTNLDESCPASLGSGTNSYTEEEEPEQTKTGGTTQSNYTSSDLQGGGGTSGGPLPSYKQCAHENWAPSDTNDKIHVCTQCGKEDEHEYETIVTPATNCSTPTIITTSCALCEQTTIKEEPPKHVFDGPNDMKCNICNISFVSYTFDPEDYDAKMGTTISTDAHVVIPETFEYNGTHYKSTSIGVSAFNGYYGSNILTITMPNSITRIRDGGFAHIRTLKEIVIPEHVAHIESCGFYGCINLETVTFLSPTTSVTYDVFSQCNKITTINYAGTAEQWANFRIPSGNGNLSRAPVNYNYKPE